MITIDMSEIKEERNYLTDFLKTRIQVSIAVKGESLILDARKEKLLTMSIKAFVKRFLHQRGLSEAYRVIEEREVSSELPNVNIRKSEGLGIKEQNLHHMTHYLISFHIVHN